MNLTSFWQARNPRERLVLGLGGGILLIALGYAEIWLPIERALQSLEHSVPALRSAERQLQIDARQAKTLLRQGNHSAANADLIRQSANSRGLSLDVLESDPNGHWRLQLADADFQALIAWLAEMQKRHGLRLSSAVIEAKGQGGRVKATLRLQPPSP